MKVKMSSILFNVKSSNKNNFSSLFKMTTNQTISSKIEKKVPYQILNS